MKLTSLLASSAALAALALVVPAATPASWNLTPTAQASTSINFSVFYDGLESEGDWVSYDDAYVFVPVNRGRHWRPYTEGHWIYASDYGWTWVSDEPFGWATYHYGRWGFDEDIGWYWVPGTRWAPAWVSWRRGGDHVAWAPLPPRRGRHGGDADFTISFGFDEQPDYYWNVVPSRSFLSVNLVTVIIDDDHERRRIVHDADFAGNVKVENNVIVNNAIDINYVEEKSGEKVKKVEVKETADPGNAKANDGQVAVFKGKVEGEGDAKPTKITEIDKVKARGDAAVEGDTATDKNGKKLKAGQSGDVAVESETDVLTGKKDKKLKAGQSGDVAVEGETDVQAGKKEKQAGKDKTKMQSEESEALSAKKNSEGQDEQSGKKKKKVLEEEVVQ